MVKHARGLARARKKGFSLVELIIVIAIMVALIAVMAPNFVKYVKKSHDSVITAAAEDCLSYIKTEFGNGTFTGQGTIKIHAPLESDGKRHMKIDWESDPDDPFHYTDESGRTGLDGFEEACGIDKSKVVKSDLAYVITIGDTVSSHPEETPFEVETTREGD